MIRQKIKGVVDSTLFSMAFDELAEGHPLQYLFMEVTRRCNLHCVYCGSDCVTSAQGGEMPVERWIEIMRQVARDFDPKKVMLAITGGEPLLKPGILDLFSEVHALGFPFGIVTNGTLVDPEFAKKLVATGIGSISISMDAPPEVNDTLRGRGVGAKAAAAVKNLQDAGFRGKLEILTTLTKPVVPHLDAMRGHVAAMRVPLWRLLPIMPIGRVTARPDLMIDGPDLRTALDFIIKASKDGLVPKPIFGEECYLGREYEAKVRPYRFLCKAGLTIGGIMYDGRVGACPELTQSFIQGDISRNTLREIWESRYSLFRDRSWTKKGKCAACDSFGVCRGGSLHLYAHPQDDMTRCLYQLLGGS
ncbi:MAG: radical SAM protein [Myxococcota bacterium]|jgi:radical SAM protein with 4Fe4S-binding SPASM domain